MAKYRAIISVEFDDNDLNDLAESLGTDSVDPDEAIQGEVSNFTFGSGWVEQVFRNGHPTVHRVGSDGIEITVSDHDLSGIDDEEDDKPFWEDEGDED